MVRAYAPDEVTVIIGNVLVSGFADGSMVKVAFNEDGFKLHVGSDGQGSRAKSANRSGTFSVTLAQTSPSNDQLQQQDNVDRLTPGGVPVAVMIKDLSGRSIYAAATAWLKKQPDADFGKEVGDREWVFESDAILPAAGGN